jgi:glycosyltransferase involved in cell wall biosynthesis
MSGGAEVRSGQSPKPPGRRRVSRPAFTCLLPVYHRDDPVFFREALESVLGNSVRPTQILICEDGELPDALRTVVESFKDERIRRVRNSGPRGLHNNLNRALALVETPWFCRADADDINLPHRFATQLAYVEQNPGLSVVGSDILEFNPRGERVRKVMPASFEVTRWAAYRNPINHMTVFARTEAVRACGGYPSIPLKEDYALWVTMLGRGFQLGNVPEVLVEARLGDDFYRRRAGWKNLRSEFELYRLKAGTRCISRLHATTAFAGRAAALSLGAPLTAGIYKTFLR